jgi:phospho-N-acetylmuramoyl-pentapeptide-transferase
MILDVLKVFAPATVAFFIGILMTPILTHYLYKHKMWKKKSVAVAIDGRPAPVTEALHKDEERRTPRMGGIVVWGSALITILLFWAASQLNGLLFEKLNFLSRGQTWLPLFTLIVGGLIGFLDDYFVVSERVGDYFAGGLALKKRLMVVFLVSIAGAWWFFSKLAVTSVIVPFVGEFDIGIWFIPFFIIVMMAVYSGSVIDGIDGLSGGVFGSIFAAYGFIAFFQNQIDLAAFSFVIVGALLAFLWFNIPPARFFLSDTGTMALTLSLTVIAFLTKQVLVLPVIASLLAITTLSVIVQVLSKKFRNGKKIILAAPLHNHLQAIGWPGHKVVMRYWVISIISSIIGLIIVILG